MLRLKVKENHMCEKNLNFQLAIIILMMSTLKTEIVHQVNNCIKL